MEVNKFHGVKMEMDEIRQSVRKLESELSSKLTQYSKFTNLQNLEKSQFDQINNLETEINNILVKFTASLNEMQDALNNSNNLNSNNNLVDLHTLQRYRAILHDNINDFKKAYLEQKPLNVLNKEANENYLKIKNIKILKLKSVFNLL